LCGGQRKKKENVLAFLSCSVEGAPLCPAPEFPEEWGAVYREDTEREVAHCKGDSVFVRYLDI
jgi:hypothetical protein